MSLLSLLSLAPLAQAPAPAPEWPVLMASDWAAHAYQALPDTATGDYLVSGRLRPRSSTARGRVALNVRDDCHYYAIDFAPRALRVVRVEEGLELPLGAPARAGLGGGPQDLLIRREGSQIDVFLNGSLVARAADDTYDAGQVACGSPDGSLQFDDLAIQDSEPAYLDDDFMRADDETGGWELVQGDWRVQSIGSPVRSTNAFNLTVNAPGRPAVATCGAWFWHDYEAAVSCQPHGSGQVGLYGHYRGPEDALLFVCGAPKPGAESAAELVQILRGRRKVLSRQAVPFVPGQWYRLALRIEGRRVSGFLDGRLLTEGMTEVSPGGQAGLHARVAAGATFDDFGVRPSVSAPTGGGLGGVWREIGGTWSVSTTPTGETIRGIAASAAKLLRCEPLTGDVCVSAEALPSAGGTVGLVAGWQDEADYLALTYGGDAARVQLLAVQDGQSAVLADVPLPPGAAPPRFTLALRGGSVTGSVDGRQLVAASIAVPATGRVGCLVQDGEGGFSDLRVERLGPLPTVALFEGAFSEEVSMADWAAESADWTTLAAQGSDPGPSYWHKAPTYGDLQLTVRLPGALSAPASLFAACPEPGARAGYELLVTPGSGGSVTLLRAGQPVAAQAPTGGGPQSVALARRGPVLTGYVNGRPAVSFLDSEPLPGLFAGWLAPPGAATPADATLQAANVLSYAFREAPGDWWVGGGDWRITNRWDCEPRWTFFIGGGKGVACLWNKQAFGPGLTLDFYSAIRFDSTQGYEYGYAANMNCAFCADGKDLSSGYNLVFGGWDNTRTRLLRGNQVLAESTDRVIPRSSSIHRQWFNVRVQKAGPRLRCWLDGAPLFDVTDPEPLPGRQLALWTYDNYIALARVRVASDRIEPGPVAPPAGIPRCAYDDPALGANHG